MKTKAATSPRKEALPVYNVTPFTMLDYPGHTACIIWLSGCNMRCPYCHNPQIVRGKGTLGIQDALGFLKKRAGILDAVVLSGGEATLYPDLRQLVREIKNLGYLVKIDTNGTRPDVLIPLLNEKLIDYIALDYKAPFYKFEALTRMKRFTPFLQTLDALCHRETPFEIRTTVHSSLLNESDINAIMDDLTHRQYKGTYYIQNYVNNGQKTLLTLSPSEDIKRDELNLDRPFHVGFRN